MKDNRNAVILFVILFIAAFYIGHEVGRYHERKALVEKATKAAGDLLNRVK